MKAESTNLQVLIEGKKQFIVPLFQRPYTWKRKDWEMLFEDLAWLYENNEIDTHFMGSIVTIPMASAPQNKINKFLLIDGQQRLTTIFVILALLRDLIDNTDTANDINMSYLINISQKNNDDYYKLLPTQAISSHISDKQALQNIIDKKTQEKHLITDCYQFFETKIKRRQLDIDTLHDIIIRKLSVVSIVLSENDDPYLIFEGLNAKGEPLSQADLIRNYFFMKIDKDKQEKIYNDYWKPMQESLGEFLTEFMRHYIISDGVVSVNKNTVYTTLKNKLKDLSEQAMLDKLEKIYWYAEFYQKLISPEYEKEVSIKNALMRIKQFNVTTAYPFLLKCYNDYENKKFTVQQFVDIIETLENFVMRRFICDIKTNELDSIFNALYKKITLDYSDNFIQGMKSILQTKHYPKDNEFYSALLTCAIYGKGDRIARTKLILEALEKSFNHKEMPNLNQASIQIEHIMPQTLTKEWEKQLGKDWQDNHQLYVHNLGNLTLTAYNQELSNKSFDVKKKKLCESHFSLNHYFLNVETWNIEAIEKRCDYLARIALQVWQYFGDNNTVDFSVVKLKKKRQSDKPKLVNILEENYSVKYWKDVPVVILNWVIANDFESFNLIINEYSNYISNDITKLRTAEQLKNGYYVETNLSADSVQRFCQQVMRIIELSNDDWAIEF